MPPSPPISRRSPGRIVDQANVIPVETRTALEPKLADLEAKSGIQLVVATVTSLEGQEIEPYANELFRAWKLGEKTKNNGVLLLVAPNERRVRIEVGYGLEGTLTDALSKVIITNAITPRFKTGDFGGGIARGVDDIITVLTTDASEWQQRPSLRLDSPSTPQIPTWLFIAGLIAVVALAIVSPGFRWFLLGMLMNSGGRSSGGGWSSGGGTIVRRGILRGRRLVGRRRRIGEMVMSFSAQERERISDAIRATEARTSGEIVCVLARTSSEATALPIFIAAVLSLALPWILVAFTTLAVREILLLQAAAFLALAMLLCLPPVRVALMPRAARRAAAYRAATDQFVARGIARKKDRAGILIFVSLSERYARIIADEGIAARVAQPEWQGAVDALIAHMRDGRISEGFVAAIERCGNVLATHFPAAQASATSCRTASM